MMRALICFFMVNVPLFLFSQIDTVELIQRSFYKVKVTEDSVFITDLGNFKDIFYESGNKFLVEDFHHKDCSMKYRDVSYHDGLTNVMLIGSTFGPMGYFKDITTKDTIPLFLYDMLNIDRMENELRSISIKPLNALSFSYPKGINYIAIPLFYVNEYDYLQKDAFKVYSDLFTTISRDVLLIDLRANKIRILKDLRTFLNTKNDY